MLYQFIEEKIKQIWCTCIDESHESLMKDAIFRKEDLNRIHDWEITQIGSSDGPYNIILCEYGYRWILMSSNENYVKIYTIRTKNITKHHVSRIFRFGQMNDENELESSLKKPLGSIRDLPTINVDCSLDSLVLFIKRYLLFTSFLLL